MRKRGLVDCARRELNAAVETSTTRHDGCRRKRGVLCNDAAQTPQPQRSTPAYGDPQGTKVLLRLIEAFIYGPRLCIYKVPVFVLLHRSCLVLNAPSAVKRSSRARQRTVVVASESVADMSLLVTTDDASPLLIERLFTV